VEQCDRERELYKEPCKAIKATALFFLYLQIYFQHGNMHPVQPVEGIFKSFMKLSKYLLPSQTPKTP